MSAASLQTLPAPLRPTEDDWAKMLAAHVHLGTKNLDNKMVRWHAIWNRPLNAAWRRCGCGAAAVHSAVQCNEARCPQGWQRLAFVQRCWHSGLSGGRSRAVEAGYAASIQWVLSSGACGKAILSTCKELQRELAYVQACFVREEMDPFPLVSRRARFTLALCCGVLTWSVMISDPVHLEAPRGRTVRDQPCQDLGEAHARCPHHRGDREPR